MFWKILENPQSGLFYPRSPYFWHKVYSELGIAINYRESFLCL